MATKVSACRGHLHGWHYRIVITIFLVRNRGFSRMKTPHTLCWPLPLIDLATSGGVYCNGERIRTGRLTGVEGVAPGGRVSRLVAHLARTVHTTHVRLQLVELKPTPATAASNRPRTAHGGHCTKTYDGSTWDLIGLLYKLLYLYWLLNRLTAIVTNTKDVIYDCPT